MEIEVGNAGRNLANKQSLESKTDSTFARNSRPGLNIMAKEKTAHELAMH